MKNDLRSDAGQLLITGFHATEATRPLRALLRALQPGGVILFARNITGAEQTFGLLEECQKPVAQPLFRCVDLEGGTVDRLREAVAPAPAAAEVASTGQRKLFRKHGRIIGDQVRAFGFNLDFAPVLDLAFEASRQVMNTRVVSADPEATVAYAREFLRGLEEARVLGCGKHFPGLGRAALDSHFALPEVSASLKAMLAADLVPYRKLRREMAFVMVAHAAFPEITGRGLPASLSKKWMSEVLRKKVGFDGLIVTDDLDMGGVLAAGSVEEAAVATLRAGADMFLVCQNEESAQRAWEAVVREAERDRKFRKLVAERARRVRRCKEKPRALRKGFTKPNQRTAGKLQRTMEEFRAEVERHLAERL
jgi:beta-N-acetylhexosaminidase